MANTNNNIQVSINAPRGIRPNKIGEVTVTYTNVGQTDAVAPLISLSATGAQLQSASGAFAENVQFLGINNQGAAGILQPGASSSFKVSFQPTGEANTDINFSAGIVAENAQIDWNSIKNDARPDSVPADAWDVIWNNFTGSVGNTAGQYQAVLADNATHLSQLGDYSNDVSRLLAFELQQSGNYGSITQRYDLGSLGRGSTFTFEITATEDSDGNVTVNSSGSLRLFRKEADGTYLNQPGDKATLTKVGNTFQLRAQGGGFLAFRPDGKFDFIEDTNSNRITATYTGNQLTRINSTNGDNLSFSYNSQSRISQVVDQAGRSTTYSYDPTGELLLSITDPQGTTSYSYNAAKALTSVTFADGTQALYDYDAQGRVIKQSLNGGAEAITFEYDSAGGVTASNATGAKTKLLLNDLGQIGQLQDALGRNLQLKYDADGNLIQQIAPGNISSNFTYDQQSNLLKQVDPLGNPVNFTYDPTFNQVQSVSDQRGNVTGYNYDDKGNLVEIEYVPSSDEQLNYPVGNLNGLVSNRTFGRLDSLSNSTGTNPTVSYYDKNGKLITSKVAYTNESIKEQFNYDPQGNLVKYVNRRGQGIEYTYDDRERLIRQTNPDGSQINFTYDQRDNLISTTDAKGTITQEFDSADRLTKITYPNGQFLQYTYDAGGRRTRMVDRDGFAVNYGYDSVGRLAGLADSNGQKIASYTYDNLGRLSREDNGNGTYTTYGYDATGQLLNIVNYAPNASVNSRFDYTYDQLGRRTSMTTLEGTSKYGYDANGQLISVTLPDNRTIQYQYDAAGNRIAVTDNGVATSYETNSLNQYTAVGKGNYTYDADGNLISKTEGGKTSTYTYDVENRLVGVVTPDGIWSYDYDAFGNRIASTKNGQRTEYLLDPSGFGNVVGEYSNGNLIARYTHGFGLESRVDATNTTAYYDFDAIGSTAGLTGGNGSYVNRYSYLPFGEDLTLTETVDNFFKFVGEFGVSNDGSGLYYMRERSYDSSTGRFVSDDPIGIGGGDTNIRQYVKNNPLAFIDPLGLAGFYNKPLDGFILNSINQNGGSPIDGLQDTLNLELSHEHILFDKPQVIPGYNNNKPVTNVGFGADGKLFSYDLNDPKQKSDFEKLVPNKGQGKGQFDDKTLVEAIKGTKLKQYNVLAPDPSKDNCQEWAERVRKGYDKIQPKNNLLDQILRRILPAPPPHPENSASTYNDPRIVTFDKQYHDFQAAGEFTLIESTSGDLKIQVRQQPVDNNPRNNVSDNTAVSTIIGGKRIGIYLDRGLVVDGVPTEIPDLDSLAVGDGRIYREGKTYTIVYPTGDQLVAKVGTSRVNIDVFLTDEREGQITGLLGNLNKNPKDDLIKRDGTVLTEPVATSQLYGEYADSWRVNQAESLFDYNPGENTNTFTLQNYPRQKVKISDLNPADVAKAEQLIGDSITNPTIREATIIDLVLTNFDPEILEAAINAPSPESSVIIGVDLEAKADFTSTFANTPVKINPLSNDIVTTGIPLSLTGYDQTSAKGGTIQLDNNGTPDNKTDDQLTYNPPTNFIGIDTINYTIADDQKTATGTITVAVPAINLNALNGKNGFTVTGAAGNFAGSSLSNIGDFNGDTIDDFIVGGFAADPNNINATGESYVVFGTNQGFPANFDLSTLNGTNGFIIEGFEAESFSGGAVSSAGDINGDGLKDLIIGAFASDSNSLNNSGRTYVILGSKQAFSSRFNLANLNGNNGFVINSNQPLDYSGLAVSSAGDFNNDGLDDLAVAAPAGINTFLGKVYLVYGRNNSFPPAFDPSDLQWDDGIVINHNNGLAGTTVSNAGDINGDQIDDLIIGAEQGSLEGNPKGGETYVLFGKDGGYQKGFSLSRLDGTNGFTIKGDGYSVSSVSGAGDINADGLEDMIIGVSQSPGNNQTNAGKAYVVFGTQAGFTQQLDLFTLNGNNGFVINGVEPDELLGGSVKGAGDINGDKIDDIIIGASGATANGIKSAGKTYVVFGSNKGFPASLNSSDLNGEKGFFLNGTAENELSGIAVSSAGDINKDSVNDILIGAPGSLFDNTIGKSYVVFGNSTFGNQAII
ncbi:RHS repeat-associated core domain-containing protein [Planktothrix agardhii]|uniref:RHS repeat-associated core domain-containing protein n=1 Tax=Planktothrix agardhii TaxID=1160 RepID=UPI001D0A264B|nr:RHS repeat-associated core domain-containing protein [Planktothrix agardhii]MCB8786123.1 VWD domain-containing protein [Planktothrix agardhii 1025]MCF3613940.1 VWD domain-containing protein [Planktothrix agardhii 1027]CAD5914817.1 tRNA3(Ser)-specific nuclease WapA [Planktothrix agardhii]